MVELVLAAFVDGELPVALADGALFAGHDSDDLGRPGSVCGWWAVATDTAAGRHAGPLDHHGVMLSTRVGRRSLRDEAREERAPRQVIRDGAAQRIQQRGDEVDLADRRLYSPRCHTGKAQDQRHTRGALVG